MPAVVLVVKGFVQGVGFRSYVLQCARPLGIVGETWNGRDQTVHIVAQHLDPSELKRFEELLWDGPGRVDGIESHQIEPTGLYHAFEVTATR